MIRETLAGGVYARGGELGAVREQLLVPVVGEPAGQVGARRHFGYVEAVLLSATVGHRVEETPRRVGPRAALYERDVVARRYADDGEQLHVHPWYRAVVFQHGEIRRYLQRLRLMRGPLLVPVCLFQTRGAESDAFEPRSTLTKTLLALQFS